MLEHERVVGESRGGHPGPHQGRREGAGERGRLDGGGRIATLRRQVDDLALLLPQLHRRVMCAGQHLTRK